MNILMIGDVVGTRGCEALRERLPQLKKQYNIDFTVVNGENAAEGNGMLPSAVEHILTSGADVITGGNHSFRRREIYELLDSNEFLLRPANYPSDAAGKGYCLYDMGRLSVAVLNIAGVSFMDSRTSSPFDCADRLIERAHADGARIIVVDFHAETTSEKRSLGFYLDGRVSVVAGTHTHVQTADASVLPEGTGYITDLGMCGAVNSVLGVKPELAIRRLRSIMPLRFENADGPISVCGAVFEVDDTTGHAKSAHSFSVI